MTSLSIDHGIVRALSRRMRSRRFGRFAALTRDFARPLRILDVGGTNEFWKRAGWADHDDFQIVTVNLEADPQVHRNIVPTQGDATKLSQFEDKTFDVVFSNSVIEHLFDYEHQAAMASEVRRLGRAYWVQTPNFWFPIEPHFYFPGWQWLPEAMRISLIRRMRCGCRGPHPDPSAAAAAVREIRLMRRSELRRLFPEAALWGERAFGLVKSWVAHHGFDS